MDTKQKEKVEHVLGAVSTFALRNLPPVDLNSVQTKRDAADLVSNRDLVMEATIVELVRTQFPDHLVLSEEIGSVGDHHAMHRWLVDPIDGSCNDSHGIPWSCVSVAYMENDALVAGLIVHPYTGEVFQAFRGEGATLNGKAIRVADSTSLSGTVVMTELLNQDPWSGMSEFMGRAARNDSTVRIMGSTALAIAQVAAGRSAGAFFAKAGALDVAAGVVIAKEAGARIVDDGHVWDESAPLKFEGWLLVACPGVASELSTTLLGVYG